MKERPILFSGPMVRAILEGRKTQTRRVIAIPRRGGFALEGLTGGGWWPFQSDDGESTVCDDGIERPMRCPFGVPGDRLWVKETWAHYQTVNSIRKPDGRSFSEVSDGLAGYKADGHESIEDFREHVRLMHGCDLESVEINGNKWRPSIFMPRWASRLLLEVKAVRVERLQEISERDAWAEGYKSAREFMAGDWASKHAETNPWVWVVEFDLVTP